MRLMLLLIFSFVSFPAFSETYTYSSSWSGGSHSSAGAACSASANNAYPSPSYKSQSGSVSKVSEKLYNCFATAEYERDGKTWSIDRTIPIDRRGDSCPSDTVLNSALGVCEPKNKCLAFKGTSTPFTYHSSTDMPPQTLTINGCSVAVTKAFCYYQSAGKAVCTGQASYSGEEGASNSFGDTQTCADTCPEPSMEDETRNKECVYITNGQGVSTCSAENYSANPGKAQCGDVNGTYTCIENPKAKSTLTKTDSSKTSTSHSDGTVTVVKNDTITTTVCKGKACSTTTTTSTGSTTTDANGQTTGNESSCSGPQCNGSGAADPTEETGEEEEGDSLSVGTISPIAQGSLDGEADKWDAKIESAKTELKNTLNLFKQSFSPIGGISLSGGGVLFCPAPVSVLGKEISFCLDKYKDQLSWISDAIYALCAILALFIVFS